MKQACIALAAAGLAALTACPQAQASWPEQPIRVVVPYPPGGNLDITTRTVLAGMSKAMDGLNLVVENVGGAAGSIGASRVARARPDGYTVLSTTITPLVVNPVLMPDTQVTLDDFAPIGMMAVVPSVLEVKAGDERYKDFGSLLDFVKKHPGKVTIGHSGNGTTNHLAILQLVNDFGLEMTAVPYKGSAPALTDLMGGQIDAVVDQLTASRPFIQSGKLHPLAVTSTVRSKGLPDVPAVSESAPGSAEVVTYSGLLAPRDTPLALRTQLNQALRQALSDPEVQRQLEELGAQVVPTTVQETGDLLQREQAGLQTMVDRGLLRRE